MALMDGIPRKGAGGSGYDDEKTTYVGVNRWFWDVLQARKAQTEAESRRIEQLDRHKDSID